MRYSKYILFKRQHESGIIRNLVTVKFVFYFRHYFPEQFIPDKLHAKFWFDILQSHNQRRIQDLQMGYRIFCRHGEEVAGVVGLEVQASFDPPMTTVERDAI